MNLYYTPPSEASFNDMKEQAIKLWNERAGSPIYLKEKLGNIQSLENVQDNFMYIFAMFDQANQRRLISKVSTQTATDIGARLKAGECG